MCQVSKQIQSKLGLLRVSRLENNLTTGKMLVFAGRHVCVYSQLCAIPQNKIVTYLRVDLHRHAKASGKFYTKLLLYLSLSLSLSLSVNLSGSQGIAHLLLKGCGLASGFAVCSPNRMINKHFMLFCPGPTSAIFTVEAVCSVA